MANGRLNKIGTLTRIILVVCAAAMVVVLFVPLWKIDLVAPQYPEGLSLLIYPDKLSGNVDIINGLNHYIGMKTLHSDDFVELKILPYIIGFFALLFLIVAITASRKFLNAVTILFIVFGIVAMVDFWKWEYDYGHHLNPDAAIVVPGMAYQPPLIGFKQLLNFSAYSFPAAGGWCFAGVGVLLLYSMIAGQIRVKKLKRRQVAPASVALLLMMTLVSCSTGTSPIVTGKDQCDFCKMTVSDSRFGAEAITKKGKIYKFDDIHCLLSFLKPENKTGSEVKSIYFTDFGNEHALLPSGEAFLLQSEKLRSPMAGNVAAFKSEKSLQEATATFGGQEVKWNDLYRHE